MSEWYRRREPLLGHDRTKSNQQQQRVWSRAPRYPLLCPVFIMDDRPHKAHRPAHSGIKADKKKQKQKQNGFNEKVSSFSLLNDHPFRHSQAFAPKSGRRADRQGRRKVERDQTRLHVPLVNRTPDEDPPPVIIAIVGPPGVGKTTLLKSLVRRYAKQTLNEAKGPITVVSGKNRRLTFVECNNDLNSMIDIGKIADLVLLMVDGSFGFEMVCVTRKSFLPCKNHLHAGNL